MNRQIYSPLALSKTQRYVLLENGIQFADRRTSFQPVQLVESTRQNLYNGWVGETRGSKSLQRFEATMGLFDVEVAS
jgi:hypothetical protein